MQKNQEDPLESTLEFERPLGKGIAEAAYCSLEKPKYHAGDLCPICQSAKLEYDGLLNLVCPKCGTVNGGSFT